MNDIEPRSIWSLGALLGEGPVWVERDRALWFVDIKSHRIHRRGDDGATASWPAPEQVSFVLPARGGGFVVGLQSGLARFDETTGQFASLAPVEPDRPGNRLNDGTVDPSGRLWFGTMDDGETSKSGAFYRFADGALAPTGVADIAITNGPAVSPDGRLIYLVDTVRGTIDVADISTEGAVANRRPFVRIDPADGYPDGPTTDAEGCVWIGLYAGWEVRRYSPAGELLTRVPFPVANITKIAFGGPDRRTVFATTACQKMSAEERERQPLAGDLFSFRADVEGWPSPLISL